MPIRFSSDDLIYIDHEQKSSKKRDGTVKSFTVLLFQDYRTKRQARVYDFSGVNTADELQNENRYHVEGLVNIDKGNTYLVLNRIGEIRENGKIYNPYTQKEGTAEIETSPP